MIRHGQIRHDALEGFDDWDNDKLGSVHELTIPEPGFVHYIIYNKAHFIGLNNVGQYIMGIHLGRVTTEQDIIPISEDCSELHIYGDKCDVPLFPENFFWGEGHHHVYWYSAKCAPGLFEWNKERTPVKDQIPVMFHIVHEGKFVILENDSIGNYSIDYKGYDHEIVIPYGPFGLCTDLTIQGGTPKLPLFEVLRLHTTSGRYQEELKELKELKVHVLVLDKVPGDLSIPATVKGLIFGESLTPDQVGEMFADYPGLRMIQDMTTRRVRDKEVIYYTGPGKEFVMYSKKPFGFESVQDCYMLCDGNPAVCDFIGNEGETKTEGEYPMILKIHPTWARELIDFRAPLSRLYNCDELLSRCEKLKTLHLYDDRPVHTVNVWRDLTSLLFCCQGLETLSIRVHSELAKSVVEVSSDGTKHVKPVHPGYPGLFTAVLNLMSELKLLVLDFEDGYRDAFLASGQVTLPAVKVYIVAPERAKTKFTSPDVNIVKREYVAGMEQLKPVKVTDVNVEFHNMKI